MPIKRHFLVILSVRCVYAARLSLNPASFEFAISFIISLSRADLRNNLCCSNVLSHNIFIDMFVEK